MSSIDCVLPSPREALLVEPRAAVDPWLAVLSVALSATVFCTTEFLPIGLLRYISAGMRVSEGTAGLLVSAPGLLAAIAAPLIAIGIGRMDRRRVLLALAMLLVASNLLATFATQFAVLIVARVLFGIGLGGLWAVGAGIGARLVREASVARATAIIFAGVSIGMLVGGAAGALIGELFGWRAAFAGALVLSVVGLVAQAIWLPAVPVQRAMPARELLGIAATPAGRAGLVAMLLVLCGQFAAYTYVTPFLAEHAAFDAGSIAAILLGYTLIGLAGNFLGSIGAARDVKTTLAATIALFFVSMLSLPLLDASPAWVLVLMAVWGIAYGAMPLALQMWMAKAAPGAPEGAMALFVANFQISIALGSFVGGVVVDRLGTPDAMTAAGVLGVAALAVLYGFTRSSVTVTSN